MPRLVLGPADDMLALKARESGLDLVIPANRALWVPLAELDLPGLQVQPELPVLPDQPDLQELQEQQDKQVQPVLPDQPVQKV